MTRPLDPLHVTLSFPDFGGAFAAGVAETAACEAPDTAGPADAADAGAELRPRLSPTTARAAPAEVRARIDSPKRSRITEQ
ncbi:hypothetical protein Scani_72720 [Streptomyces caniferus]|uniref:Uncharacterized protein n=1 Tax=Streptomyces caniferus TaxID=285557 RepID=A0A640SJI9_9ACTN|nr:hypothetical protein Scani_72720 [Streptomyces caniferus]